jgi:hypothetical protein
LCLSFTSAILSSISLSASIAAVSFASSGRRGWKMGDQHGERIADAAKLLAVGGDVGEHLSLDRGIARLAVDVDEPELAAGHERGERID